MKKLTPRPVRIEGDIAYVPLTQDKEAIIDASDVHLVENNNWHLHEKYAASWMCNQEGKPVVVLMHRHIAATPKGLSTDHVSGNTLDNRRCNLRWATQSQNCANIPITHRNTSGKKGICWRKSTNKWQAQIKVNQKHIYLGCFDDAEEAADAYAKAAEKYFGEFSRTSR